MLYRFDLRGAEQARRWWPSLAFSQAPLPARYVVYGRLTLRRVFEKAVLKGSEARLWLAYAANHYVPDQSRKYAAIAIGRDHASMLCLFRSFFPYSSWRPVIAIRDDKKISLRTMCQWSIANANIALSEAVRLRGKWAMRLARKAGARNYASAWLRCRDDPSPELRLLETWMLREGPGPLEAQEARRWHEELAAEEERLGAQQRLIKKRRETLRLLARPYRKQ